MKSKTLQQSGYKSVTPHIHSLIYIHICALKHVYKLIPDKTAGKYETYTYACSIKNQNNTRNKQ